MAQKHMLISFIFLLLFCSFGIGAGLAREHVGYGFIAVTMILLITRDKSLKSISSLGYWTAFVGILTTGLLYIGGEFVISGVVITSLSLVPFIWLFRYRTS